MPVFVLDPRLLDAGRFPSANRAWFLLASLRELRASLRERGGELFVRAGRPEHVLPELARETGADAVHFASDVSPFALARDRRVEAALAVRRHPATSSPTSARRARPAAGPSGCSARSGAAGSSSRGAPSTARRGRSPCRTASTRARSPPARGPRRPTRSRPARPPRASGCGAGSPSGLERYHDRHDRLAGGTSELSPYLHFGCVSAREVEQRARAKGGAGAAAFVRQLAWRDFYAHVLLHHPGNARHAHRRQFDALEWEDDPEALDAWRTGRTGFPVVDAAMRQLLHQGWMHNRARLIVGSFLTKDLHLDWRAGEAHFMRHLLCGDEAQNNGNWQWIASVGVDPGAVLPALYNPMAQQRRHDPDGEYVRRWCPELRDVPLAKLAEPWTMTPEEQAAAGCTIGADYPAPIVDHARERRRAIERYRAVAR